ncbi:hypothetical protein A6S26_32515 [Nostoc sp. ATCC 43529]|nr:hypothetical protein A6S26_32515 [Nostoc sp. ATCC 43529]
MKLCPDCGFEFHLNVVSDRRTGRKYLRSGCCDGPLRACPDPCELLREANITQDEREYLQRLANLDWFSGQVAAVLLQIETKAKVSGEVAV